MLGTVWSAPLLTRLHDVLIHSDNVLAEAIGREMAVKKASLPPSRESPPLSGTSWRRRHQHLRPQNVDASGLSLRNRVSSTPSLTCCDCPQKKPKPGAARRSARLGWLRHTLDRFYAAGPSHAAGSEPRPHVSTASSLAGIAVTPERPGTGIRVHHQRGRSSTARPVLDALAATLQACGCQPK
ncbi:MAG: D-alanyl-D-alanine carboxypeptidase [Lawsonella clevelandensis]